MWKVILEITILWFIIYHIILFFETSRAVNVLKGIIIILVSFFIIQRLGLTRLDWLFTKLFAISIIALLVIFQPEIRQGLARLGQRYPFRWILKKEYLEDILKEIILATENLAKRKTGALIAIARNDSLKSYIETGVMIDAYVTADLIETIFTIGSPLHDGGLIIQNDRIVAGGCIFPLTEEPNLSRIYGMRHRAGIGLTEVSDAVVIIVSEERSEISLAHQGKLFQNLKKEELLLKLIEILKV